MNSFYKIFIISFFLLTSGFTTAQINPNSYWSEIGAGSNGPISRGALVSTMNSSGMVCIAGEVEINGDYVIRVAIIQESRYQILGLWLQDSIFASIGSVAWANNGDIYIGGSFQEAVNSDGSIVSVNNVVRWNSITSRWENLGQGVRGNITAIAVDPNQNIYIGGNIFEGINPDGTVVSLNNIGRWNNSQDMWETIGDGVDGGITDIDITSGGELIVTGEFINVFNSVNSSIVANGIAAWNGTDWDTFGQGFQALPNAGFLSTKISIDHTGNIIAAGYIDVANNNGTTATGPIVMWDGTQWISLVNGLTIVHPISSISADASGNIYMLHFADEQGLMVISSLNQNNWTTLAELTGINRFYTITSNPFYPATYLYAGGRFSEFNDPINNITETFSNNTWWDGSSWKQFNQPGAAGEVFTMEADNILTPGRLYVGGSFSSVSGIPANNIALFDGGNWEELGNGVNGTVHTIKAVSDPWEGVFVGGLFDEAGNPDGSVVSVSNLAFWDESLQQWFNVGGFDGPVYTLENFSAVFLYAGGDFNLGSGGNTFNNIARFNFNSQTWEPLGDGVGGTAIPNPVVRDIKLNAPNYGRGYSFIHLYVGGNFLYADQPDGSREVCRNVMLWDEIGERWYKLGNGTDDEVLSLAIPRYQLGDLWVGGRFRTAVNRNGSFVSDLPYAATWNGFEWVRLGMGLNGPVYSIELLHASSSGKAFLGGEFTQVTNPDGTIIQANNIASFNRTSNNGRGEWKALGDGTDSTVHSIASVRPCPEIDHEVIYTGGKFFRAGFQNVKGLAKWKAPHPVISYSGSSVIVNLPSRSQNRYQGVVGTLSINCGIGLGKKTDDLILFDDLSFREAETLSNLPYLQPFSLTIYDVENPNQPIAVYDNLFTSSNNPQLLILFGVDDTISYASNPDNISIAESVILKELVITSEANEVPVVFVHSITDAPTLDIVTSDGDTLISDLMYGTASTMFNLPPDNYSVSLLRSSDKQNLGNYNFTIEDQSNEYNVITLSGFLNPAANLNGPELSIDIYDIEYDPATSIKDYSKEINELVSFELYQNYPNPFNPITTIKWQTPINGRQTLKVYDLLGREVATLVNEQKPAGKYEVTFNADGLASGVYFYRLTATSDGGHEGSFVEAKKFILMK